MKKHYVSHPYHVGVTVDNNLLRIVPLNRLIPAEGLKSLIEKINEDTNGKLNVSPGDFVSFSYRRGMSGCYDFWCSLRLHDFPDNYKGVASVHVTMSGGIDLFVVPVGLAFPFAIYMGKHIQQKDFAWNEARPRFEMLASDIVSWPTVQDFLDRQPYYTDGVLCLYPTPPSRGERKEISLDNLNRFEQVKNQPIPPWGVLWVKSTYKSDFPFLAKIEEGEIYSKLSLQEVLSLPRSQPFKHGQRILWPKQKTLLVLTREEFRYTIYNFPGMYCGGILVQD